LLATTQQFPWAALRRLGVFSIYSKVGFVHPKKKSVFQIKWQFTWCTEGWESSTNNFNYLMLCCFILVINMFCHSQQPADVITAMLCLSYLTACTTLCMLTAWEE
jgi:hypothetical protein